MAVPCIFALSFFLLRKGRSIETRHATHLYHVATRILKSRSMLSSTSIVAVKLSRFIYQQLLRLYESLVLEATVREDVDECIAGLYFCDVVLIKTAALAV